MASIPPAPHEDPFLTAVARTLSDEIRSTLKAPLMRIAEATVDAAVDKAMVELNVRVKAWVDNHEMETTIKIITDRRTPDADQA